MSNIEITAKLNELNSKLNNVSEKKERIGTMKDGPILRSEIDKEVKDIVRISGSIKKDLEEMSANGEDVDSHAEQYSQIQEKMRTELPSLVKALKEQIEDEPVEQTGLQSSLLDMEEINDEREMIESLESEISQISSMMIEMNQIFKATFDKLNEQKPMIVSIDSVTSSAVEKMQSGNEDLITGKEHQKHSTKCMCWLFLIVLLAVGGISLFIYLIVSKSKK